MSLVKRIPDVLKQSLDNFCESRRKPYLRRPLLCAVILCGLQPCMRVFAAAEEKDGVSGKNIIQNAFSPIYIWSDYERWITAMILALLCLVLVLLVIHLVQRRRARLALQTSEKQFRLLADHAPEAIVIQTREVIAYVNAAFCRMIGAHGPQDLQGRSVYDLFHPDYHSAIGERIRLLNVSTSVCAGIGAEISEDGRNHN